MRYKVSPEDAQASGSVHQQLVHAIQERQHEAIRKLIDSVEHLPARGPDDPHALWEALRYDEAEVVLWLLDAGESLADAPRPGWESTPPEADLLHDALALRSLRTVFRALERGADARAALSDGITPLQRAVRHSLTGAVAPLVRAGADPNAPLAGGLTLFEEAHTVAMVEALLDAGARPSSEPGRALETIRLVLGNAALLRRLISAGADVHPQYGGGDSPLVRAAREGELRSLEVLLDAGAARHDTSRALALLVAAEHGHLPIIEALLRRARYSPEELGHALCGACYKHKPDAILRLIKAGASVTAYSRVSAHDQPLHLAARHDDPNLIELLLDRGAQVDAQDRHGRTPLWIAATRGHTRNVELLLTRGADHALAPHDGQDAYEAAYHAGHFGVLAALRAHGAQPMSARRGEDEQEAPTLREGASVTHPRFGVGEVLTLRGDGDKLKAHVRFADGERTLLARFLTVQ